MRDEGENKMITEGKVTLPNGQTIEANQYGSRTSGSDRYPIVILGWSASGKTLFCQEAKAIRCDGNGQSEDQAWIMCPNPKGEKFKATWRNREETFRKVGRRGGFVDTDGFDCYCDPSF